MIDRSIDSTDLLTCFDAYCLCVVGFFFACNSTEENQKHHMYSLILTVASGIVPMFALFNRSR
jgi:hypothetical protein